MRWLILMLALAATAGAQPAQFANQPTGTTDYTCVGTVPCATWPMPSIPASGAAYVDPTFGTTSWRLAVPPANTSGSVIPSYARVQAWNSSGSLMFMTDETHAGIDLYDATKTPPAPINLITTDGGSTIYPDAADNDALWSFTDPHRIYFTTGSGTPNGLNLGYVDVSTCTTSSCVLHYNIVHTFSCATDAISNPELGAGVAGNKIETGSGGQGGLFDSTDTYFSFTCDKVDGSGRHEIDFIRYNRLTDTVVHQQKWYTLCPGGVPEGCAAYWGLLKQSRNLIRMNQHPDHHYISVIWQAGSTNGTSGTSSAPTHVNITSNVLTVTASNTLKVNTEAKFHNLNAATYLNNQFVIITSASSTQFTAAFTHADDDQAIASGTITGLSCQLEVNWVRGCGVEVFDDDYTFLGPAASYPGHQDWGYDVNGVPVFVNVGSQRNDLVDTYALSVTDLTNLSTTAITSKRFLWPCSYSRIPTCVGTYLGAKAGASHISMVGTWGSSPGYGLFSTMMMAGPAIGSPPDYPAGTTLGTAVTAGTRTVTPASMTQIAVGVSSTVDTGANMETVKWTAVTPTTATAVFALTHAGSAAVSCLSCGDAGFAAMENLAVKIDSTATDGTNLQYWRLGRTMGIRDNMYNAEPHSTANRDFTQFVWGSTWNTDPGSSGSVFGFWTALPTGATPPLSQFSISRTASSQTPTPFPVADRICCGAQSNWTGIETARGTYVFTLIDGFVTNVASHPGTFLIYTDRAVPTWANGTGGTVTAPTDLTVSALCQAPLAGVTTTDCQYKEFVTKFMQHVCGVSSAPASPLLGVCTVKVFEIWNEMNVGVYWTDTVAKMAQMAQDKAAIIRLYCGDCTIIGGSVSAGGDGTGGSWINGSVGLEPFLAAWGALGPSITPIFTATITSNANSTGIVATPARKQLTNCATGYSGGSLQPTGVPVGELYCTTANQTAGQGAGGPTQGIVVATSSGTGIAAVTNGLGAGGTNSPSAITDTYGGSGDDAICTGDTHNADATPITGLAPLTCVANASAVFAETSATGKPFPDTLWPTEYNSNSVALDAACCYYRDVYFELPSVSTTHVLEMDVNLNSSPTAYGANRGGYFGWGFQYNVAAQSFQYCPQGCSNWMSLRGKDIAGVAGDLTTYPLTSSHWYHIRQFGHRLPGCSYHSTTNCFFYDALSLNDVTAATAPITYRLVDDATGLPAGGIPVNNSGWDSGPVLQEQIDMVTAAATATAHIVSDSTVFYQSDLPDAVSWHAYPSRTTIKPVPFPETLLAHGSGTCTGSSNSSCRTAIKDQVSTLYSTAILNNTAVAAWASNLPVWQTEGGFGLNSGMTDGIADNDANTYFLRGAFISRWMAVLAAAPATGMVPPQSMVYSWQDQCWGTNLGTNVADANCQPPDSVIPSGVTPVNTAVNKMKGWLDSASSIGSLTSTAVSGGNIWKINLVTAGSSQQLAWFDGWLTTTNYATTFGLQQTLGGINSTVSGTVILSNQPTLLSGSGQNSFWFGAVN